MSPPENMNISTVYLRFKEHFKKCPNIIIDFNTGFAYSHDFWKTMFIEYTDSN